MLVIVVLLVIWNVLGGNDLSGTEYLLNSPFSSHCAWEHYPLSEKPRAALPRLDPTNNGR
jgi:hypothetical protein